MNSVQLVEGRSPAPALRADYRKSAPMFQAVDSIVAASFEIDLDDIRATKRGSPRAAFARQVAMYLAHVVCSLSLTEIGISFGRDRSTVAHACCVVEDRRDDPELDFMLDQMESAIVSLVNALGCATGCR